MSGQTSSWPTEMFSSYTPEESLDTPPSGVERRKTREIEHGTDGLDRAILEEDQKVVEGTPDRGVVMKLEASTIEEYFEAAGDRSYDLREIDRVITETAPGLKRQLFEGPSITMIGYGEMEWERASDSGVWPLIGVAAQEHHISVYVAALKNGVTLAEHYQDRLGKTHNGKNCIRFRRVDAIDLEIFAEAVRDAVEWGERQQELFLRRCARPV